MKKLWAVSFLSVSLFTTSVNAIVLNQIDDFQDGTSQGWSEGGSSPNPPVAVAGGQGGAGDYFLQNVSAGGGGPGSKMVMFNQDQWTGDYIGAGVTALIMDLINLGDTLLHMRIEIEGAGGSQYISSSAFLLEADGIWRDVSFDLSDLSLINGSASLEDVLMDVTSIRLLSSETGASRNGDAILATLGVDNIQAVPLPTAAWLFLSGIGLLGFCRREKA